MLSGLISKRLVPLDNLRGIAVLLVLLSHFCIAAFPGFEQFEQKWLNFGVMGVFIFFCVSGYVIPMTLRTRAAGDPLSGTPDGGMRFIGVGEFVIRRACRLYPVYLLAMGLGVLGLSHEWIVNGVSADFHSGPVSYVARLLTFTSHWDYPPHWRQRQLVFNGLEWTLAYEMVFYCACAVFLALRKWLAGPKQLTGLVLALCGLVFLPDLIESSRHANGIQLISQTYLFFAAGLLAYLGKEGLISRRQCVTLSWLVVGSLVLRHGLWYAWWGTNWRTLAVVPALVVFYAVVTDVVTIHFKPLTIVGVVSYSTYLVHNFVHDRLVLAGWDPFARMAVWVAVVLLVSVASFVCIEQPMVALGKWLTRPRNG